MNLYGYYCVVYQVDFHGCQDVAFKSNVSAATAIAKGDFLMQALLTLQINNVRNNMSRLKVDESFTVAK